MRFHHPALELIVIGKLRHLAQLLIPFLATLQRQVVAHNIKLIFLQHRVSVDFLQIIVRPKGQRQLSVILHWPCSNALSGSLSTRSVVQ